MSGRVTDACGWSLAEVAPESVAATVSKAIEVAKILPNFIALLGRGAV
jgi:hypothetical protein